MNAEERTIKASILAGITDIIIGLIMFFTGFGDWYYSKFHVFGIIGLGMLAYGFWHLYFLRKETGVKFKWMKQK